MPAIPQYQQQTRATSGELGPGPQRSAGGGFAVLAQAADTLDLIQQKEDAAQTADALSSLRLKASQRLLDAKTKAAADGTDFTPNVLKQYDDDVAELKAGMRSNRARDLLTQHSREIRENLGQRALHFEANTKAAFRVDQVDKAIDRVHSAVELDPDQWQQAFAEQDAAIQALGIPPEARLALRKKLAEGGFEAAARGMAKRNPTQALAALKTTKSGDARFDALTPEARQRVEEYARVELINQTAGAIAAEYRKGVNAGTAALAKLQTSNIDTENKVAIAAEVRQRNGLLHAERREQFAEDVNALERSIAVGQPGPDAEGQATRLYRRSVYSPEQYTNVLQAIDEARQRGAKKAAVIATVDAAITNGLRLDPKDEKVVDAVDTWFSEFSRVNQVQPGSDEWINNAAAIANKTNILPPSAMGWARSTILSGEPEPVAAAAGAMQRWSDAAPYAYAYFDDPNIKALAGQVDSMVRAGVKPAKAVELARANTFDIPKARQDELHRTYAKEKYGNLNSGDLQSRLNADDAFERGIWGKSPSAELAMQDEYNALVRAYYDRTNGDIEQARALAYKDIRGTYGVSTVNGEPEVMKYAPELVFPGIDPAVIQSDVADAAKGVGVSTPVKLTPSRATGDSRGLLWELSTVDQDGLTEILLDEKNRPRTYMIPTDTNTYIAAQEQAKAKAIEAAKKETALRQMTADFARDSDPLKNEVLGP